MVGSNLSFRCLIRRKGNSDEKPRELNSRRLNGLRIMEVQADQKTCLFVSAKCVCFREIPRLMM